jgi:PAS domain S-box-containing protein
MVIIDGNGVYQMVNQKAAEVMGVSPQEMVGKSMSSFFPEHLVRQQLRQNAQVIDTGVGVDYEATIRVGQNLRTFLIRDRCLADEQGHGFALQSSGIEITDLRRAHDELRALAGHLQTAREEERLYVAREIHDHFSQVLSAMKIDLALMMKETNRSDTSEFNSQLREQLFAFDEALETVVSDLRKLVTRLRPEVLESIGVAATMEMEVHDFGVSTGLDARFISSVSNPNIDMEHSIALYRILQESLSNIRLHAQASHVIVSFEQKAGDLTLQVEDDGRGFPTEPLADHIPYGILGMKERALLLGGEFSIARTPSGKTVVRVSIPFAGLGSEQ